MKKAQTFLILFSYAITTYGAIYDVTNYGAIANDGIDDLPAINLALANAFSGDTLYFPSGTFDLAGQLYINNDISVNGNGELSTTLKYMNNNSSNIVFIAFEGVGNVTISNFTIDINQSEEVKTALDVYSPTTGGGNIIENLTIKNIDVSNGAGIFLVQNSSLPATRVQNCHLSSLRGHFTVGIIMYHGSYNIIENNLANIGGNGIVGINFSGNLWQNEIYNVGNDFENDDESGFMSIELHSDDNNPGPHDLVIEGNEMDSWMSVVDGHDIAIRNNQLIGDGWLELGFINGVVSGNTVDNTNALNPDRAISGIAIQTPCKNLLIIDNVILNTRMAGIGVNGHAGDWPPDHVEKIYFKSNHVENTQDEFNFGSTNPGTAFAIVAYAYQLDFDENYISNNKAEAFSIVRFTDASNLPDELTFINNIIEDNGGTAFLDGGTTYQGENTFLESNIISGNGDNNSFSNVGYLTNQKPIIELGTPIETDGIYSFPYSFTDDGTVSEILWDFGEGLPNTNISPTHSFSNQQTYKVSVVAWDNEGRATYDFVELDLVLGKEEQAKKPFLFYPNPTNHKITIPIEFLNSNYSIFSINGQRIKNGIVNSRFIDLKSYQSGVYFIKITNNETNRYHLIKVIKE